MKNKTIYFTSDAHFQLFEFDEALRYFSSRGSSFQREIVYREIKKYQIFSSSPQAILVKP